VFHINLTSLYDKSNNSIHIAFQMFQNKFIFIGDRFHVKTLFTFFFSSLYILKQEEKGKAISLLRGQSGITLMETLPQEIC